MLGYIFNFYSLQSFTNTLAGGRIKTKTHSEVKSFISVEQGHQYFRRDIITNAEFDYKNLPCSVVLNVTTDLAQNAFNVLIGLF